MQQDPMSGSGVVNLTLPFQLAGQGGFERA